MTKNEVEYTCIGTGLPVVADYSHRTAVLSNVIVIHGLSPCLSLDAEIGVEACCVK